jgi:hypothetical protein
VEDTAVKEGRDRNGKKSACGRIGTDTSHRNTRRKSDAAAGSDGYGHAQGVVSRIYPKQELGEDPQIKAPGHEW